jgi:16S rRNA (cytosine967-C5)-methyltransferase
MPGIAPARVAAFTVLKLVDGGGLSDELLVRHTVNLDPRDAALCYELVLGCLRRRLQLRYLANHFGAPPPERLDLAVRLALELGFYQLRFLERVPAHAAVAESVELVKRAGKRSAAGLVNAILRKDKGQKIEWPSREVRLSTPEWLLARWGDRTETIGQHSLTVPPSGIDAGSRSIVPLVGLQPHHRFLDLCAAPGNKTRQAMDCGAALVVACDRSAPRLETVPGIRVQLDAAQPLPFRPVFDRILVDAPCSGTGTLARNPEIKWRLTPGDLSRQQERQRRILASALDVLAPGGRLVYSTCSLEPEENEAVVAPYSPTEIIRRWPGEDEGDGFFAAILESK